MTSQKETVVTKDVANKKITVIREFDAAPDKVWRAWTESELLDQWWAPRPWKAKTKKMDFREGGHWLYSMIGPDGTSVWARADFKTINAGKSYTLIDAFCDENGVINKDFPSMHWKTDFSKTGDGTKVRVEITFESVADMDKILEMGFQEGFTAAHGNLDELLAK